MSILDVRSDDLTSTARLLILNSATSASSASLRTVFEHHALASSSSRMRSAAAKSRRRRAAWRSSIAARSPSTGTGGVSSSARRSDRTPSTRSKCSNAGEDRRHVARPDLLGVDRGVQRAHQVEHRAQRRRGVEVVAHRLVECVRASSTRAATSGCAAPARDASRRGQEIGQPAQRLFGLLQARPGEVELLAVVRREQQVAQRRRPEAACRAMSGIV